MSRPDVEKIRQMHADWAPHLETSEHWSSASIALLLSTQEKLLDYVTELEGGITEADKAICAMWKTHDRGDHSGSPGEWIWEIMQQVGALADNLKNGAAK